MFASMFSFLCSQAKDDGKNSDTNEDLDESADDDDGDEDDGESYKDYESTDDESESGNSPATAREIVFDTASSGYSSRTGTIHIKYHQQGT